MIKIALSQPAKARDVTVEFQFVQKKMECAKSSVEKRLIAMVTIAITVTIFQDVKNAPQMGHAPSAKLDTSWRTTASALPVKMTSMDQMD